MTGSNADPAAFDLKSPQHLTTIQKIAARARTPQVVVHFEVLYEPSQRITLGPQSDIEGSATYESLPLSLSATNDELYGVASYAKVLLNAAFVTLVDQPTDEFPRISWDESACDLFNTLRQRHNKSTIRRLWGNPTLRQLLSHVNGFAPMDRYLLAPDGTCIMSEAEFIEDGPRMVDDKYKSKYPNRGWQEYSNGNHIFGAMILQEAMGVDIHEALKILLLDRLNMPHTIFSHSALSVSQPSLTVVDGYRILDRSAPPEKVPLRYLDDVVEAASIGARSTIGDIANFNRHLLKSICSDPQGAFSQQSMTTFFTPEYKLSSDGASTLAGLFTSLNTSTAGEESLNNELRKANGTAPYRLGCRQDKSPCNVYYKGGAVDGFAISVYLLLNDRTFLIVMCNSSGPLDPTDHIAKYILHQALALNRRLDVLEHVEAELSFALAHIDEVTAPHNVNIPPSQDVGTLAGLYQHVRYSQRLRIWRNGDITVGGRYKSSPPFKIVQHDSENFRVCPGNTAFACGSWFEWQDLEFELRHTIAGNTELVGNAGRDVFRKLQDDV